MSRPDRRLAPVVWCVDEIWLYATLNRNTPPDPAIVAALRAVLAHGAAINGVVGISHAPKTCTPRRHRRRIPLRHKEI
jgi:hypothetical protein